MTVTAELFTNPTTSPVVTSGGTTTPAPGTQEAWTVTGLSAFPAVSNAAAPPTFCRCCDPALPSEILWITNISGTAATVIRGAEGTATVNHGAGFSLELLITAGGLGNLAQGWPGLISSLVAKSGAYTATAADNIIVCNATSAAFTITLPTAVGALGRTYTVKKTDSSANAVTVDPNGSQTIDGATTYSLFAQWQSVTVVSDGANWQVAAVRLYLDTTAGDIQALGVQAAGASGLAADAKHVHPMPSVDQLAAPAANVTWNSKKITSLANGSSAQDAAAIGQVALLSGATFTGPVTVTGFTEAVVSKSANYTATSADSVILCNAAGGAFTITLPAASGITGRIYTLKKTDTSANIITVDANASETIDGTLAAALWATGQSLQIVSDGTNWQVLSPRERSVISMTSASMTTQTTPIAISQVMTTIANEAAVGTEFEIEIDGVATAPTATASATFSVGLYIDGIATNMGTLTIGGVYMAVGVVAAYTVLFRAQILTTGAGGSCTVVGAGGFASRSANAGSTTSPVPTVWVGFNSNGGVSFDTTVSHTLRLCGAWGSTSGTGHHAGSNRTRMTRR